MSIMPPKVSVITPTKNRRDLLCEAVDSVAKQTCEDWEHIIVDDGSDDGTAEEIRRRAGRDPRVRYIKRTSVKTGANVCRNIGIRESRSDLIVFLDSDDLLRPSCLATRIATMERNSDLDFAVSKGGIFIHAIGDYPHLYHSQDPGDDLLRFLSHDCVWEISGPIWRRRYLQEIGCFDEELLSMQDLHLHVRAICTGAKYIFLETIDHDIRGNYDVTRTSNRHFADAAYIAAAERVRDDLFEIVNNAGLLTWSRERAVLGLSFGIAESWFRVGRSGVGIRTWFRSCKRYNASLQVLLSGFGMLGVLSFSRAHGGLAARLVNKWKGWVRFRQEPKLMSRQKPVAANS